MTTDLESEISNDRSSSPHRPFSWLKLGIVATGSALVSGLAAAWYYRNTLSRLRQAEDDMQNPESGEPTEQPDSEE